MTGVDRAACAGLILTALAAPWLAGVVARTLEPRVSVGVFWVEQGGTFRWGRHPDEDLSDRLDPWGRPFAWLDDTTGIMALGGKEPFSLGPDPDDPRDDISVESAMGFSLLRCALNDDAWKTDLILRRKRIAAAAVVYLALAWRLLRRAPRRPLAPEAGRTLVVAAPCLLAAGVVSQTDGARAAAAALPLVSSSTFAVAATGGCMWLLAALAVRLLSRPPEHA